MQVLVARIGKPHGIRGEVTVQLFTDNPEDRFAPGATLDIENFNPASAAGRIAPTGQLTVKKSRWNKKILVVAFDEIKNRNQAEELRDTRLTFDSTTETQTEDDDEGYYEHELLDLPVYLAADIDEDGYLPEEPVAVVTALQTMPTQDLLVLESSADGEEIMIPFVEELVPAIDTEEGYIIINPPAGLFELNSDEDDEADTESERA